MVSSAMGDDLSVGLYSCFLSRAEKICRLDLYVFEEVCALLARWNADGKMLLPISVNLSRQHFKEANFLQEFADIAKALWHSGGNDRIRAYRICIF